MIRFDLEAATLAALDRGEAHGYEIMRRVAEASDGAVRIAVAQIYPTLHRLESEGLVVAAWQAQVGKPNRKVYELTDRGREQHQANIKRWQGLAGSITRLMGLGNA